MGPWATQLKNRKAWYRAREPMAVKEEIVKMREPTQRSQGKILGSEIDTYSARSSRYVAKTWIRTFSVDCR
jgi:hypothetical protein